MWFDQGEIKVGDSISEKVASGILESGWLVLVMSRSSVTSAWVKKELSAAITRELEERRVFILPVLLENCEIPVFLRDKLYADFREDYAIGLEKLLYSIDSWKPGQRDLQLALLPAFRSGEVLKARDMVRIQHAINLTQSRLKMETTKFHPFKEGQILTADSINDLLAQVNELRRHLGLGVDWEHFPVRVGEVFTADALNELQASMNEVLKELIEPENTA